MNLLLPELILKYFKDLFLNPATESFFNVMPLYASPSIAIIIILIFPLKKFAITSIDFIFLFLIFSKNPFIRVNVELTIINSELIELLPAFIPKRKGKGKGKNKR